MKRNFTVAALTLLIILIFQTSSFKLESHIVKPLEGGLSGDPNQTNCAHCHSSYGAPTIRNAQFILKISQDSAGLIGNSNIITGSSVYTPGYTQWISIELTGQNTNNAPATPDFGFQFTALSANDSMAASFTLVDPKTSMETSASSFNQPVLNGPVSYVGHANADTTHIWYFKWTAPDSTAGPVTFYYAGNLGNGDVTSNNDTIFLGSATLNPGPSSTLGINNLSGNIHSISVYPVPFSNKLNADLYLSAPSDLSVTLLSLEGQSVKELYSGAAPQGHFSRSFDIADIAAGVYLVRVQSGTDIQVQKVMKY